MSVSVRPKMTADEFLAWATEQPEGERSELVDGEVFGMVSERARHARAKGDIFVAMRAAMARASLTCEAFVDGMAVRVGPDAVFVPDGFVRCGAPLADDAIYVDDPVIVIEVVSPSTSRIDADHKFAHYFLIPSVEHYLIVDAKLRNIIHHRRAANGEIATRIVASGPIMLDPPGIELPDIFADLT